ncbi:MAG: Lrp/AsnC family transcriptional regulator, partial [Pseudomonadota bacterium]
MKFSDPESRLLRAIQADATLSLQSLAERVGMASSTVWRKLQDFDATGLIAGRVTLLSPKHAGCG